MFFSAHSVPPFSWKHTLTHCLVFGVHYTGRNPKTGKKVKVVPKKLPYFKCGKELRERVDK